MGTFISTVLTTDCPIDQRPYVTNYHVALTFNEDYL